MMLIGHGYAKLSHDIIIMGLPSAEPKGSPFTPDARTAVELLCVMSLAGQGRDMS